MVICMWLSTILCSITIKIRHTQLSLSFLLSVSVVSRSVSKLQRPLWPDPAVPHCSDRGRHFLLRDPAVLQGEAGNEGRERLGWVPSGTRLTSSESDALGWKIRPATNPKCRIMHLIFYICEELNINKSIRLSMVSIHILMWHIFFSLHVTEAMHQHLPVPSLSLTSSVTLSTFSPLSSSVPSSRVSPFSLLLPLLLSLLSTGTKRCMEWKKYIRYPPSSHRPIIPTSLKGAEKCHKKMQIDWNNQFPLHCSNVRHLKMSPTQKEHVFPTVDMVALPTLCPCDFLLNLHLYRVPAVMAFSFLFCHALSYLSSLCTYLVVF